MATDTAILKRPAQDFLMRFDLLARRHWRMMNVDADGVDGAAPESDPATSVPIVAAYDGVSSMGTIQGSVEAGGWSCALTIPKFPADFDQYFGVDIGIQTFHANVPGVPGAAGVDPDGVRIFRGYQQTLASRRRFGWAESQFPVESSSGFLKRSQLRHGFDF